MKFSFWKNGAGEKELEIAVSRWRDALEAQADALSDGVRRNILREAMASGDSAPVPVGVRSAAWRLLGAALPMAAAVLLVLVFADRVGDRQGSGQIRVIAEKAGAEVVFSIKNGHRAHSVLKSSTPSSFEASSRIPVRNGSFRDSMDDGSGLVFYRID